MRQVITVSTSGKMVVTKLQKSHSIEFLNTTTWKVIARTNIKYEDNMEIAFSPDEEQVALLSRSLITIWDIMHPEKRVSFNPWLEEVWSWEVAFQTSNDLVICAVSRDYSLQVWHRQDPAGFECTYSLDFKVEGPPSLFLASDGLTVVIVDLSSSATCFSWNHDTAQFDPVHFDDQVHIPALRTHPTGNSLHVGLTKIPTSEFGTHELANSFPSFQRPTCIALPSHLL